MNYNIVFVGFGSVGQALARLLIEQKNKLRSEYGTSWQITGIASRRKGWRANPSGFDVDALLSHASWPEEAADEASNVSSWLAAAKADVLFEVSSLNALTGQPAISYIEAALRYGAHVVTANKGPVVYGYRHLRDIARTCGKGFRFESTVMDGAPIFSLFRECMPLARVTGFQGILNSTTNYLLGEMESGSTLESAVRKAQDMGIAETDPAADIDGFDAAVKVAALASVIMDVPLELSDIARRGIRDLDPGDVRAARAAGTPYKLMCRATRVGARVIGSVGPERLPLGSPFAHVDGTSSTVHFETDILPGLTVVEHTPTPATTAYGLLADFISLARHDQGR